MLPECFLNINARQRSFVCSFVQLKSELIMNQFSDNVARIKCFRVKKKKISFACSHSPMLSSEWCVVWLCEWMCVCEFSLYSGIWWGAIQTFPEYIIHNVHAQDTEAAKQKASKKTKTKHKSFFFVDVAGEWRVTMFFCVGVGFRVGRLDRTNSI